MSALRRPVLRDIAALVILAVAVLAVAWPLGLTNRILAGIDAFTYFTPYWSYRIEAFRAGFVPLWNPYLFSGAPFLANIQAAVLYPLHWPLSWLPAERALVWSALLHLWLAAAFTYILARRSFRASRPASLIAALIFALGGFSLARIENINQLNALAWLPALLWLYDETVDGPRRALPFVGLTIAIALQLLAGHTQTTFINMVGLGLWALVSAGRPFTRRWLIRLLPLLAVLPALALSAAQLLPTLELNALGLRTGGLDFRSAVSFSLRPRLLAQSLLPPFFDDLGRAFGSEGYAEFVGYVGIVGLLLAAVGALSAWRCRRFALGGLRPFILLVAGFLLALGAYNPLYYVLWRFVPGFDLFRAPARWLELYALGVALLAAIGFDALANARPLRLPWPARRGPRLALIAAAIVAIGAIAIQQPPSWPTLLAWLIASAAACALIYLRAGQPRPWTTAPFMGRRLVARRFIAGRSRPADLPAAGRSLLALALVALLLVEFVVASRALPFTAATAPMATDLRNSTAALLATEAEALARDRVLSLSDIRYDPGDLAELRALQSDRIPPPAVERLVRAAKQVEVLAPNLPLFFRLPAVDGYDGGLLPLHRYVLLQGLFLDADKMTPDGRLAEQLDRIPDARLLDLTGVRYVITDKQRDLWAGDVYFDQEQTATIPAGATFELDLTADPPFEATGFDVMAASGPPHLATPMTVTVTGGSQVELRLATTDVFSGTSPLPQRYTFPPATPVRFTFRNTTPQPITLYGLSLVDERTGAHQSVTLSPRGDFRRIHSGDVKIYERIGALGRAWLVHGAVPVADEDAAARVVDDRAFDPRASVIVEAPVAPSPPAAAAPAEQVETLAYEAERAVYQAQVETPGWLVIADAWYPGWKATVDGAPAEITRANLLYRAIALEPGAHRIELTYRPAPWQTGRIVSLITLAALVVIVALIALRFLFPRLRRKTV